MRSSSIGDRTPGRLHQNDLQGCAPTSRSLTGHPSYSSKQALRRGLANMSSEEQTPFPSLGDGDGDNQGRNSSSHTQRTSFAVPPDRHGSASPLPPSSSPPPYGDRIGRVGAGQGQTGASITGLSAVTPCPTSFANGELQLMDVSISVSAKTQRASRVFWFLLSVAGWT